jgi:alpha-galactosidase
MADESSGLSDCRAELDGDVLVLANAHIERKWRVKNGLLFATSIRDLDADVEWLARPSSIAAPCPDAPVPDEERALALSTETGRAFVTEAESLRAELRAEGPSLSLVYRFQIFPDARGVCVQLLTEPETEAGGSAPAPTASDDATGVESGLKLRSAEGLPRQGALEQFDLNGASLRLTQVVLADCTDRANELVQEREWLLHPSQHVLELDGNLMIVEDPVTQNGLILLKHAPLPHARPVASSPDLRVRVHANRMRSPRDGESGPDNRRHPLTALVGLYGHGYPHAVLTYSGGAAGRTRALHTWQRQFRTYEPGRDGLLLSNTWGDRSQDSRVTEEFIRAEIESAKALGVDVMQIDDGWQQGRTANSAEAGGIWTGFWAGNEKFWTPHTERLPNGLEPIAKAADEAEMNLGLWFAPDLSDDYANWERDAEALLDYHRRLGVCHFKLDGTDLQNRTVEARLHQFIERVVGESKGEIVLDYDITAGRRPGYFGSMRSGPLFVENRYTDWHNYWPHQTLRNLWSLAQYVDPVRLRMEFLNNSRNAHFYGDDPLAPGRYPPDYLFATVMFASPLGWFEVQHLPDEYVERVAPLVSVWREHRKGIHGGCIHPIGERPDGAAWTGFASVSDGGDTAYVLVFRELSDRPVAVLTIPGLNDELYECELLAGDGLYDLNDSLLTAELLGPINYMLLKLTAQK